MIYPATVTFGTSFGCLTAMSFFALNSETAAMKWINSLNSQYTELNTAKSRFTDNNLPIHVAFSFKLTAKASILNETDLIIMY